MRTKQVEGWVFRKNNDKIEFLLLKRIPEKGGFWQPTTGGVEESDNSLLDAAYREIKEEVSVEKENIKRVLENVHYFQMDKHYLTNEKILVMEEFVFGFEVDENCKISISNNIYPEHQEFVWVSFNEALNLLKWDNNKDALIKLNKLLVK
jgi:dihydroneopterin triphosphate diphosphatase